MNRESPSVPVPDPAPLRKSVEEWYNDVDVSVSSTGSEIRRRLHADILARRSMKEMAKETPVNDDVSPIAFTENHAPNAAQSFQMFTPLTGPLRMPARDQFFEPPPAVETQSYVPSWVSRNPHLSNLFDPSRMGTVQLPPLFRHPITPSTAQLQSWSIPQPVLYGLGQRPN